MPWRTPPHGEADRTADPEVAIRRLYWCRRINQTCLSRMYGVSPGTVHDVVNYVTWTHVEDTFEPDQITREVKE